MNVTPGRISQLISEGRIPRERDGKLDPEKARRAWAALKTRVESGEVRGGGRGGPTADPDDERLRKKVLDNKARLEKANADIKELQAARLRGELVEKEQVARLFETAATVVREQLRSMPARLAGQLVGKDAHAMRERIAVDVERILEAFREAFGPE